MDQNNRDIHNKDNLKAYLKSTLLKNSIKLKFKYPPISELVRNSEQVLKIRKISRLSEEYKDILILEVKNYIKNPKLRFFFAILLANQSSDFLVILAKNLINFKDKFRLIQYPIYPQFHRIGLLCLIEIEDITQIPSLLQSLKEFKMIFRRKLDNLKNI